VCNGCIHIPTTTLAVGAGAPTSKRIPPSENNNVIGYARKTECRCRYLSEPHFTPPKSSRSLITNVIVKSTQQIPPRFPAFVVYSVGDFTNLSHELANLLGVWENARFGVRVSLQAAPHVATYVLRCMWWRMLPPTLGHLEKNALSRMSPRIAHRMLLSRMLLRILHHAGHSVGEPLAGDTFGATQTPCNTQNISIYPEP
jgi:hypothetical protein